MVELADTRDLKSLDGDIVPVRPRLAAPVESLDAQVAFGAFVLLRLFPRACGGFRFVSASRTEPGRSPRPRLIFFFYLIARAAFACRGRCGGKGRKSGRGLLKSRAVWAILETGRSWAGSIQEAKTMQKFVQWMKTHKPQTAAIAVVLVVAIAAAVAAGLGLFSAQPQAGGESKI